MRLSMDKHDFFELILDNNEPYLFTHFCSKNLSIAHEFYLYIKDKLDTHTLLTVLDGASKLQNSQEIFDHMQTEIKEIIDEALDKKLESSLFNHHFFYYYVEHYTDWIHFYKSISPESKEQYVFSFLDNYLNEPKIISEKEFLFIQGIFKDKKRELPMHVLVGTNYTQEFLDLGFDSQESMRLFVSYAYSNPFLPENFFESYYHRLDLFEQHDFKDAVMANYRHILRLDEELTGNTISILKAMNISLNYSFDLISEPENEISTLYKIFHATGQKTIFKLEDYLEHAINLEQIGLFEQHSDLIEKLLEMTENMPQDPVSRLKKLYNFLNSYQYSSTSSNEYLFTETMKENFLSAIEKSILNITLDKMTSTSSMTIKI